MKKIFCAFIMVCAAVSGVFAQQRYGIIRELTGDVELKPAGASEFSPAHALDEVAMDTIVSTGFKSTAIIAAGSSVITVRPLTRLSLAELQLSSGFEKVDMNLQSGRVRVDVKPPAGTKTNFTVQSPSATASVRGTVFEFDTLNIKVLEGTVSFLGSSGLPMPVPAGGESSIGNDGSAADPQELLKEASQPSPPEGTGSSGENSGVTVSTGEFSIKIGYPEE